MNLLKKNFVILIGLICLLLISIILAVSIGSVNIPKGDVYTIITHKILGINGLENTIDPSFIDIVWQIRFPRVLLGVIVGSGLALCGVVMQGTVQNPLADPYILGISSGGTLGATFAMLMVSSITTISSSYFSISFCAFLGALIAAIMVFRLSSIGGRITPVKLILSGIVVNLICTAFSSLMIYMTNDNGETRIVMDWTMGSLTSGKWDNILVPFIVVLLGTVFFQTQFRVMNTMLLGDEAAVTLGIDLHKYRKIYLVVISILTGVIVANCGIIGFIGLVIPHITRSLVGTDHKINLHVSMLIGAIFLVWADVLARIILKNMEMPIGIITAIIGAPFFMYIMIKRTYTFGER
ncbi:fecCD transport family protein [Clostridium baratii str. Sullivan]|uniref:FecCD transport family protein n=1 Tax=Clostridium baratii str. Sullivan TaxID=1415775 RepID=A0A0A7FWX0_9CLOT|nr:iron ABC transporter permease [Clostridium baratii]AIY84088.1 fecCD transport family protein [Clostridium baratii str. Sullivan]